MEINESNITPLIEPTGDPFADIGGYVIEFLTKEFPGKSILELIEYITKIYVNQWEGKLHPFFLNSKITQPAFKGDKKIEETLKYYKNLLNDNEDFHEGYCRISGKKTNLFYAGRDNHILSGSGTFVNFHHYFQGGLYLSKEVLIRMFFVPYGVIFLGDKVALLHSNVNEVTKFFVKEIVKAHRRQVAGASVINGVLKSEFNNPANGLFEFAKKYISDLDIANQDDEINNKEITLNLYHFTNFGASPDIKLYTFPSPLFKFYTHCLTAEFSKDWKKFVNSYYKNFKYRDACFNLDSLNFELTKKNNKEIINYESYKTWSNLIYDKLLSEQSILKNILFYNIKHEFDFRIVEHYQKNIRNMDKKTLDKIKAISQFIIENFDKDKIKKIISKLNGAKKSYELRSILLTLIKENFYIGKEVPLITLDEYVTYLFPDGTSWSEIRDLLLISIYQKLHENKINFEIELPEPFLEIEILNED